MGPEGIKIRRLIMELQIFVRTGNKNLNYPKDYDKWFDGTLRTWYMKHGTCFRKLILLEMLVNGINSDLFNGA